MELFSTKKSKVFDLGKFAYVKNNYCGSLWYVGYIRNEKALKAVGLQIRKFREGAGFSQQKFADLCDMELSQVNRIELGKVNTSVSVLFKFAEILEIKPAKLLEVDI